MRLNLEYPITQTFGSQLLAPLAYTIAFISIIFLSIINVALTGYETVPVFQSDFNVTQSLWYHKFLPYKVQKPGTLCEPHVFNVGESFTTNNTLFEWNIKAIIRPNAGKSGVSYTGTNLNTCDVKEILFSGDLRTWSAQFVVVVQCQAGGNLDVIASTYMDLSPMPGNASPMLGWIRSSGSDPTSNIIVDLLTIAVNDIGTRCWSAFLASNRTAPVMISYDALLELCPASLGPDAPCATSPPRLNYTRTASVLSDGSLLQNGEHADPGPQPLIMDDMYSGPMSNFAQLIWAAVRIDLGNPSPNNFLLYPDKLNKTLLAEFPATFMMNATPSDLYATWASRSNSSDKPIVLQGPANLQVVYLCHFQKMKSVGSLVVSVLVATLSMFSTGWAVFLLVATYLAKMDGRSANYCDGCKELLDSGVELQGAGGARSFVTRDSMQYGLVVPPLQPDNSNTSSALDSAPISRRASKQLDS